MKKVYTILPDKIELANLIREKITPIKFEQNSKRSSWWKGYYDVNDYPIYIYFKYLSNNQEVYNVDITYRLDGTFKPLSPSQIKQLLETMKQEKYENKKN